MKNKLFSPTLQLLLATIIWGSSFFVIKQATSQLSPAFLVGYRFLLAALFTGVFVAVLKRNLRKSMKEGVVLGLVYVVAYLTQTIGIQSISSANSSFITGLFVITTPVFSFLLFRKVPSKVFFVTLTLAGLGLWILTGGISKMNQGDYITLIVPFSVGLYNVLAEKILRDKHDALVLCFHQMWVMGSVCFVLGLLSGQSLLPKSSLTWVSLAYLALFPTVISFFLQLNAQRFVSANRVGIVTSLEPVFASLFAWLFAGEFIGVNTLIGGLLIFGAMVLSGIRSDR